MGAPVENIPHDVQGVYAHPLNQGAQLLDQGIRAAQLHRRAQDVIVIRFLVDVPGVDHLLHNVGKIRRHGLADLGAGIFGGGVPGHLDQPVENHPVPIRHVP